VAAQSHIQPGLECLEYLEIDSALSVKKGRKHLAASKKHSDVCLGLPSAAQKGQYMSHPGEEFQNTFIINS